jgi:hypothetical protein
MSVCILLEAMAAGLPVDESAAPLVIGAGDRGGWARAIERLGFSLMHPHAVHDAPVQGGARGQGGEDDKRRE